MIDFGFVGIGGLYIEPEPEPWYVELGLMVGTILIIIICSCILSAIPFGIKYLINLL